MQNGFSQKNQTTKLLDKGEKMDINFRNKTVGYLKRVLELDCLEEVKFDRKELFVTEGKDNIEKGIISEENTEKLFRDYSEKKSVKVADVGSIDIVISIYTLLNEDSTYQGLLNVPTILTKEGKLIFDMEKSLPWIPRERLKTPTNNECDVMVGNLSSFWKFQKERSEFLSQIEPEVWGNYLEYSRSLFKYVEEKYDGKSVIEQAQDSGAKLIENRYFIKNWESINPTPIICELYSKIGKEKDELPLFDQMISLDTPKVKDDLVDEGKRQLDHALASSGTMSGEYPLANSQRRAMHAFTETEEGEVLAVSGPPGTGKTTMLQAVVGSVIVRNALEELSAPIIVGTSTNNQAVTNIIDSFGKVVLKNHGALDFRWLPRLVEKKQSDNSFKMEFVQDENGHYETMAGIAVYCPAKSKVNQARKKDYIVEQPNRSGAYAIYSDPSYIAVAKNEYIKHACLYIGEDHDNITKIKKKIHNSLVKIDCIRKDVLISAWNYKNHFLKASELRDIEDEIVTMRKSIDSLKDNLTFWMQVDQDFPKKGIFRKKRSASDESIIALKSRETDSFEKKINSIEEIISFYSNTIRDSQCKTKEKIAQKEKLEAVRKKFVDAFENVLTYQTDAKWFVNDTYEFIFHDDRDECKIAPSKLLNNLDNINPQLIFDEIDKFLDISLRYCEFWLSIHYYEACWLELAEAGDFLDGDECWKNTSAVQEIYWNQGPDLTPCFVMTEYQLPKYFASYNPETKEKLPDYGRIDLLVTDEAGQVNTPVAMAGFSLAKKAIVLGDTKQLAPIWGLDEETDKSTAREFYINEEEFLQRKERGLNCSDPASIMLAAENACKWRYSDDEAGLFLEEHYRCVDGIIEFCNKLLYNGRLKPCRGNKSKLAKILKEKQVLPFVLFTVKGSEDKHSGSSRFNDIEGKAILDWIRENKEKLETLYSPKSIAEIIGVVTPFAAQARRIQNLFESRGGKYKDITVGTAHRLQGAERPVILFSATYGNNSADASFVNRTPNLMNVAVSRAKDLFIVFAAPKRKFDTGKVFKLINRFGQDMQISLIEMAEDVVPKEKEMEQESHDACIIGESISGKKLCVPIKKELEKDKIKKCPNCGKELKVKDGKYGKFMGCVGFPLCRYTEKIK